MRDYEAMRLMVNHAIHLSTAIQKIDYAKSPNCGKFMLVGSIPIELTHERQSQWNPGVQHDSNIFETERDAINALLALGVTRFQLSDCSWYKCA